jgi:small subunit ribosomal protein S1
VKVLDIDRDRQRISLGLKQTQEDPWQRIMDTYNVGDELAGKVTKVVTFGAFVEVLDGVEGLVHISELAGHHVESPREIVHPSDEIRVKILEIDSERRRLSLSAKRVEDQILPLPRADEPAQPGIAEDSPADQPLSGADGGDVPAVEEPVEQSGAEAAVEESANMEFAVAEPGVEASAAEQPLAETASEEQVSQAAWEEPAAQAAVEEPAEQAADEPPADKPPADEQSAAQAQD